jgi:hypothetical protein
MLYNKDSLKKCIHTYMHTYIHTYMHTYIHTYVHTYIHIRTYTYTHAHRYVITHREAPPPSPPSKHDLAECTKNKILYPFAAYSM